jgi:tetratricopeptide (TPR) repeat protein
VTHAEALEAVERGDFADGLIKARSALGRDSRETGQILLTIAWIELERGNPRACARLLAEAKASGAPPYRARCLNGLRLCAIGDYKSAVAELSAVMDGLRDDGRWLANALVGRGIAAGYLLRFADADRDFAAAEVVLTRLGEHERVATCVHNRGFVALQAGDLPRALELFGQAGKGLRAGRAEALIDHASALLAAGMVGDASALLEQAEQLLAGRGSRLAEAILAAGYCALDEGDLDLAACHAKRAQESFRTQRRPAWVAVADALALRTGFPDAAAARRVADRCVRWGRRTEAAELLLAASKVSPELLVRLQHERHASTARLRAIGWLARARLSEGVARAAACRAGMRVVTEYASAMGAGARELAAELAGTAIAGSRSPRSVFTWVERQRITLLPQADRAGLVELRSAEIGGDMRRVAELEARMRHRRPVRDGAAGSDPNGLAELMAALGDRVLVSFSRHDGEMLACVVTGARVRLRRLGVVRNVGAVWHPERSVALDRELLSPLRIGDRPLVVVPAGGMSGVVWAALPSCVGRPVSVVPSAMAWLRALRATPGAGSFGVAGPGLAHADREVGTLGHVVVESKVETVLAVMERADMVHVAAHGRFRHDAPAFSSLQLGDGPLYGYDLARLKRTPRVLVLSACEVAKAEVFANVVLERGTQALIASVLPVPDERAVGLMVSLHARLRGGEAPAAALARSQAEHGHLGFTCLGSG